MTERSDLDPERLAVNVGPANPTITDAKCKAAEQPIPKRYPYAQKSTIQNSQFH